MAHKCESVSGGVACAEDECVVAREAAASEEDEEDMEKDGAEADEDEDEDEEEEDGYFDLFSAG